MTAQIPETTLGSEFSSVGATATDWATGQEALAGAELYWLSTVRGDGRPHVTPLIGVWLDGAAYFCTGPDERKTKNLAANTNCVLTTGHNTMEEGLDIVLEGTAEREHDAHARGEAADAFEQKYGELITSLEGTFYGLGDDIRHGGALLFRITPRAVFGFGKGAEFSQTRWLFAD